MKPTSSELIEAVADVLRTNIAPLVQDQPWPASELRTIDALLAHVAARVDHEHEALVADNADLDGLLADLAEHVPVEIDVDPAASVADNNLCRRTALEKAIHLIHDGSHTEQVAAVRAYFVRAAARDEPIYRPFGSRPLF